MTVRAQGEDILRQFGARIGIEELAFDDNTAILWFDGRVMEINFEPHSDHFQTFCALADAPASLSPQDWRTFSEVSYSAALGSTASIVYDALQMRFVLIDRFFVSGRSANAFTVFMEGFMERVDGLSQIFEEMGNRTRMESAPRPNETEAIFRI